MSIINNPFKGEHIEFHILQSFPVTCLNRDDVGAPKTAVIGGVTRARVSSQCWKRAVRMAMHDDCGIEIGFRTRLISELLHDKFISAGATEEQANACGLAVENEFKKKKEDNPKTKKGKAAKKASKDTDEDEDTSDTTNSKDNDAVKKLIYLSPNEITSIVNYFKDANFNTKGFKLDNAIKDSKNLINSLDGLDIGCFGRMSTDFETMNTEAASAFSNAISTHKITNDVDYITALDDFQKFQQGAGFVGNSEFNSATYYRYVTLNLGQLYEFLNGNADLLRMAIKVFIKALFIAVPTAKQNGMAGFSNWDYAKILVRKGQNIQISFEDPIKSTGDGFLKPSIEYLKNELAKKESQFGPELFNKIAEFDFGGDDKTSISTIIDSIVASVKE